MKLVYSQKVDIDTSRPIFLLCVFRDEGLLLEYFIKYYRSLGVTHFIMVDNLSEDSGSEYLKSLKDINLWLYRTEDSYRDADFGTRWVNLLLKKHCLGQYCFTVDVDELFIFDTRKYISLQQLTNAMELAGANVIATTLLDMYPKETNDDYFAGKDFLEHSPYFDRFNSSFYQERGQIYGKFPYKHGGVRKRVLDTTVCIHKFPFFKYDFISLGVAPGYHFFQEKGSVLKQSKKIKLFDESCILMHFKFIKPGFKLFVERRININEDWGESKEYKAYHKALGAGASLRFYKAQMSRRFHDISSLDEFLTSL